MRACKCIGMKNTYCVGRKCRNTRIEMKSPGGENEDEVFSHICISSIDSV